MSFRALRSGSIDQRPTIGVALLFLGAGLVAGCGGTTSQPQANNQVDLAVNGQTVTKVRTAGRKVVLLEERLTSIFEDGPQRTLAAVEADGQTARPYPSPSGWSVVDFALHPSGDVSAVLTTATQVRLMRFDGTGAIRSDELFIDPAAASDPFFNYAGGIRNDQALQPALMHDAARLVPLGESLALILRTGRNAIVAYRLDPDAGGAYQRSWRTLVEPGSSILAEGITSGSFDTFGQLQNHLRIFADVDSGTPAVLAVGAVNSYLLNYTFRGHSDYFGEPIAASEGLLLTRLSVSDGHRLGSTAIDTHQLAELHGLRATPNGFVMAGRVFSEQRSDGSGWDAFAAFVGHDGASGPYRVVDVNQGDVFFDAVTLPSGRYLALGVTGYTQNPTGASISEAAQPLLALLNSDGTLARNLNYIGGPRHNQLTSITPWNDGWLLGGMVNGPGTHSGDGDRTLITADGFVREDTALSAD